MTPQEAEETTKLAKKAVLAEAQKLVNDLEGQHRERARTLSEFANKLIARRRRTLPTTYDEWLKDMDIFKRAAEHLGATQMANELRVALYPEKPPSES